MGRHYYWPGDSPIDLMEVIRNPSDRLEAVIYAPIGENDKVSSLPHYLSQRGFICYLDEVGGKNALKVRCLRERDADRLMETLKDGGFVTGQPVVTGIADKTAKLTTAQQLRKNGLQLSGFAGDTGHLATIAQGIVEKDTGLITTGTLYGLDNIFFILFGNGTGGIRFSEMMSQTRDHLAKEGITLPPPSINTPEVEYRHRNLTLDFVKTHPVQIANTIGLAGNIAFTVSGLGEMRRNITRAHGADRFLIWSRLIAGVFASSSALAAIFIHEKTPEEVTEDKKKNPNPGLLHKINTWISQKPLAIQGTLNLIGNAFLFPDAVEASRHPKASISPLTSWTRALTYTTSSSLGAISSKNRDKSLERKEVYNELYAQAANLLLDVPDSKRGHIVQRVAAYLATNKDVHVSQQEIETGITAKLAVMQRAPWLKDVAPEVSSAAQAAPAAGNTMPGSRIEKAEATSILSPALASSALGHT